MQPKNLVSWKILVITLALQIVPVHAQTYMDETLDEAGEEMYVPPDNTPEIKHEKKGKLGAKLKRKRKKHAVFLERSSHAVRGTSSNRKVTFSATRVSDGVQVSFILNGKEFRYVYDTLDFKERHRELRSIEVIPNSPEYNMKSSRDHALLALLTLELRRDIDQLNPLEFGILSSVESLTGMFPQDVPFDKPDSHEEEEEGDEVGAAEQSYRKGGKERVLEKHSPNEIVSLCAFRGSSRSATFDDKKGRVYRREGAVGDPASECLGRCGTGCLQTVPPQARKRQYTEACFAHDLCVNHFGQIRGKCGNELDEAQDDYFIGANCGFHVVGKWRTTYDWGCDGSPLVGTVTYYPDHRVRFGSYTHGTWALNGNRIIVTYTNGLQYTGTIEGSNMETKGTMSVGRSTGCFTATYLTTSTG